MQGRLRILILVALLIVVGAIVAVFLLGQPDDNPPAQQQTVQQNQQQPAEPTAIPATPIPTQELTDLVVAVQAISRGSVIPPNAVRLQPWPLEAAPFNAVGSLEDVIGKRARTDIFVEQPILQSMVVEDLSDLANVGSDAAAILQPNTVAVALPMDRLTSVAYAIQPGDRVDIIVSLLFVDIDEEFQSILPNTVNLLNTEASEEGVSLTTGTEVNGRFETIRVPLAFFDAATLSTRQVPVDWPVLVRPREEARPRLVTQRTIQDALVVWVGDFPEDGKLFEDVPTPTPIPVQGQTQQQQQQGQQAAPPPTVAPPRPDIVTLAVSPQESVMLTWMVEARIPITFTLRAAADTSRVPTDPVTLDYIMNDFGIAVPVPAEFSIQPAIRSIRQLIPDTTITLNN